MVVKLGDQYVCQKARSDHTAWDGARWCWGLGDLFAPAAGFLQPRDLDHLQPGGDQFKDFADILTQQSQVATAIGAGLAGIKHDALARSVVTHPGFSSPGLLLRRLC